jgi:hypothetical protein
MSPVFCHLLERFFSFVFLFSRSDWKKLICFRFQLTTEIKTFCAVAKTILKKTHKVNSFLRLFNHLNNLLFTYSYNISQGFSLRPFESYLASVFCQSVLLLWWVAKTFQKCKSNTFFEDFVFLRLFVCVSTLVKQWSVSFLSSLLKSDMKCIIWDSEFFF